MDPEALHARLLGPMDLRFGERQLPPLDSARAESLLGYLLLHRNAPQPRQRLAFLLWPGSTERQAQTNLRKVLHNLRRALPGADRLIEIGPRTLRWRADVPLWLDVEHFEMALAEGSLEEAVETYAAAMRPFSTGAAYLNFTHEADRVRDAYGDGKYARLVALKDTYDPANLFRLNQNIRPSHTAAEPALA